MRRTRVLIDLVPIRPGKGGTGSGIWTHALRLVQELDRQPHPDLDLRIIINPEQRTFFEGLRQVRVHRVPGLWGSGPFRPMWINVLLPLACLAWRVRVLHKVATETPLLCPAQRVTTVHDFFNEFMVESGGAKPSLGGRYFAWVARVCFAKSRVIITVSEAIRQEAIKRFPRTRASIRAIHNGADLPAPLKEEAAADGKPFTVLCVAKLMPYKGQMEALEAFDRLLERHPELMGRARLVLHGFNNDQAFHDALRQRMHQGRLAGAVEMRPYGQRMGLQQIYAGADAFLFLTRYEGFGLPIVESQALGVPVVCSDIPVLREVGGDGAVYVERTDAGAVADALFRLLAQPGERRRLTAAGIANVRRFSWADMAHRTADAYREAVGMR
jgi:glycosyltransferase involved in cell wall biosynthesis